MDNVFTTNEIRISLDDLSIANHVSVKRLQELHEKFGYIFTCNDGKISSITKPDERSLLFGQEEV